MDIIKLMTLIGTCYTKTISLTRLDNDDIHKGVGKILIKSIKRIYIPDFMTGVILWKILGMTHLIILKGLRQGALQGTHGSLGHVS